MLRLIVVIENVYLWKMPYDDNMCICPVSLDTNPKSPVAKSKQSGFLHVIFGLLSVIIIDSCKMPISPVKSRVCSKFSEIFVARKFKKPPEFLERFLCYSICQSFQLQVVVI